MASLFNGLVGGQTNGCPDEKSQHLVSASAAKLEQSDIAKLITNIHRDLVSQQGRLLPNLKLAINTIETFLHGGMIDDRKYLVESIVQLAASLPKDTKLRTDLNSKFIQNLWQGLQHPPISYLGDKYLYRSADGSDNNIMYPQLGAAGSHYARTVSPMYRQQMNLPDPNVIFETLMARNGPAREHPAKVSSSLFHFATIIIHDLFNTDPADRSKTKNSSYLDLSPLYGNSHKQQKAVRTHKDGLLKKDVFAERRLLNQPPGACAMIVAFNRFHNYVVGELAEINERGRFSLPPGVEEGHPDYEKAEAKRDNDLFQTGRLITCGLYVNVILGDYLRTILNLNRSNPPTDWKLDPREDFSNVFDPEGTPRGIGNQVSAEFNLIYRWHSAVGTHDQKWAEEQFYNIFGEDADWDEISVHDFLKGVAALGKDAPKDPGDWSFGGLSRGEDGSFKDADLVKLMTEGTDNVAGAFGGRNVPRVLRAVEVLGIEQGRKWGLASLNELRKFFKLEPYKNFSDMNPDPAIAQALESLYGHPDNVEMYPGIVAEAAKEEKIPGSGLCPGFTLSYAILSDATALVRGDRFYATDYNPANLTAFGYAEADSNSDVAGGGVMYKLLMRAFPSYYRANSVYAMYPFTVPSRTKENFATIPNMPVLDYLAPQYVANPTPVFSWKAVTEILSDQAQFRVPWGPHTFQLTGHDYMLSGDTRANACQREVVKKCLYSPQDGMAQVRSFYEKTTTAYLRKYSRKLGSSFEVDIVKEIGNKVHVAFVAEFFGIPLRCRGGGPNSYTEETLAEALGELFSYVFLDLDPTQSMRNLAVAKKHTEQLGKVMEAVVAAAKSRHLPFLMQLIWPAEERKDLSSYGVKLIDRLLETEKSVDKAAWTLIPTAAAASATQAQGWAQMIDLYLSDEYYSHWADIQVLAKSEKPEAFELLKKYALEGFRLSTPAFGLVRNMAGAKARIQDGQRVVTARKDDIVFVDFITAGKDPTVFPDPDEIKLDRPEASYIHHGWGPHSCLGREIVTVAGASMLRACARLGGLRRAPGPSGEMKSKLFGGAFKRYLSEDGSQWGPFPVSKKVVFDYYEDKPSTNGRTNGNGHSNGDSDSFLVEHVLDVVDEMSSSGTKQPKVLLFDIGGVCVVSPFQSILDYELSLGIPPGWINYSISKTKPDGFWHRLETGSIPMDAAFFAGFNRDLHGEQRWTEFYHAEQAKDPRLPKEIPPLPSVDGEKLFQTMMVNSIPPDPWMYPALQRLKESGKYILAALSNTVIFPRGHPLWKEDFLDDPVRSIFEVFISSAHVGLRKPDPAIYELALKTVSTYALKNADTDRGKALAWSEGIKPQDVVFLDDIGENLKAGREYGFRTIKVHLGRAYEAVEELEKITGLALEGDHPKIPVKPNFKAAKKAKL
ncbi:heme peroxidase [Plectosphaerella plurivora]|uniref:Heme peroxidase n=1 Tax=Plectosphaerella plurivora TaxID=936078 RepID=A0A9P8VEA7_9PEZI|nr:heme peroxidase [Plectosphaerella plurivora]